MSGRTRFKLAFGAVVLALLAASGVYLSENPGINFADVKADNVDVKIADAEVVMDGFSFSKTEDGATGWRLDAKKAELHKESGLAKLEDLQAVYQSGNGRVLTLTADKGEFNTETRAMRLERVDKDVKLSSSDGYSMFLKDVEWDNKLRQLKTTGRVTIEGESLKLEGGGMVADADMEEIRIVDGVRTVFNMVR